MVYSIGADNYNFRFFIQIERVFGKVKRKIFSLIVSACMVVFASYPSWAAPAPVQNEPDFQLYEMAKGADITLSDGVVTLHKITPLNSFQTRGLAGTEVVQTFASEAAIVIPTSDELTGEELYENLLRATEGHYYEDTDSSLYCTGFSTVIYSSKTVNNKTFKSITSITGGFRGGGSGANLTSGVKVEGQYITFGQCGMTESDGYLSFTGDDRFDGDERNWTTSFNFKSWVPVFPSYGAFMNCRTEIHLGGRGSWEFEFVNTVF